LRGGGIVIENESLMAHPARQLLTHQGGIAFAAHAGQTKTPRRDALTAQIRFNARGVGQSGFSGLPTVLRSAFDATT
jgi:hypothetical protein